MSIFNDIRPPHSSLDDQKPFPSYIRGDGDDMYDVICCGNDCGCHKNIKIKRKKSVKILDWFKNLFK